MLFELCADQHAQLIRDIQHVMLDYNTQLASFSGYDERSRLYRSLRGVLGVLLYGRVEPHQHDKRPILYSSMTRLHGVTCDGGRFEYGWIIWHSDPIVAVYVVGLGLIEAPIGEKA